MSKPRLTPSMIRVLENLESGRSVNHGFARSRSTSGGLSGTYAGLIQRGFITRYPTEITEAGRSALASRNQPK